MRCEICGVGDEPGDGLRDDHCWDATATPEDIDDWVRRLHADPMSRARTFLGSIGSPESADALRRHLSDPSARVRSLIASSLGWSGDSSDGPALLQLLRDDDPFVRRSAMRSLTELGIDSAIEPLAAMLREPSIVSIERAEVVSCLVWFRHAALLPELRELLRTEGFGARAGRHGIAEALARVGDGHDREAMRRIAVERLERSAADGYVEGRQYRGMPWDTYVRVVDPIAPDEVAAATAALSDAARLALTWHPYVLPTDADLADRGPLTVPRRTIVALRDSPPDGSENPPGKFGGQPDWRETPAWPVGGDGRLLMFYGQLPLTDGRTGYLFTAGPDEWDPLGSGSAMIVQPGGRSRFPTVERAEGPQIYTDVYESDRFVGRSRSVPLPERFVEWSDGFDPAEFARGSAIQGSDWNKVGGSPLWLQGEGPPAPGWRYAFQFTADGAGGERGDGAVFYGWISDTGDGALGWDCH